MNREFSAMPGVYPIALLCLLVAASSIAQVSPEEHARHHPGAAASGQTASTPAGVGGQQPPAMAGGMMEMMQGMHGPPQKELYPSLMQLPDLPPEKRAEVERQARERMEQGTALLAQGVDGLAAAAPRDDFGEMQSATALMREGLAEFESGMAARQALDEGKSPQGVALQWFKREMNLLPVSTASARSGLLGFSFFHLALMAVLATFSVAMIGMYFSKMRRASALLERLTASPANAGAGAAVEIFPDTSPAPERTSPNAAPVGPVAGRRLKWAGKLKVSQVFDETPLVKTFRLADPAGGPVPFEYLPGQFLTLTVTPNGKAVKRSYSFSSSPAQRAYAEVSVKREDKGLVSTFLHDRLRVGDEIEAAGPSGVFTFTGEEAESVVLLAGGIGITPLMSIVRYLTDKSWGGEIYLLVCSRTPSEFAFQDELRILEKRHSNLHLFATMTRATEAEWTGPRGRFTPELILRAAPNLRSARIHICGPPEMIDSAKQMVLSLGVSADRIKIEAFGPAKNKAGGGAGDTTPMVPVDGQGLTAAATVTFALSKKSAPLPVDEAILDVADRIGVEIESSCRVGTCGTCKVKLVSGAVTMEVQDALEPEDKEQGMILACQAKSTGNVAVEA